MSAPLLDLRGLSFEARVCKDGDETGSHVADVSYLNLDRMLWIERDANARTLSFQLDADSWLKLAFTDARGFAEADARCTRRATGT